MTQGTLDNQEKDEILRLLHKQFGPLLGGKDLIRCLGFTSMASFRQAVRRDTLPVKVFELEHRRGKFALTSDVAHWLMKINT